MDHNTLKDLKILLVEDEEQIATLIKKSISDNFYSFTTAFDGEDGFEKFQKISPDIVISDIMMPKLDGLSMAQKIREIDADVPIIILSAFSDKEKLIGAINAGVTKYFIKPFDPDELIEYIETLSKTIQTQPITLCEGFIFNKTKRSLYKDGKYLPLTKREVLFMEILIDNLNGLTNSDLIKEKLWEDGNGTDITLRSFIKRFRLKTSKNLVENIKGEGYRLLLG